MFRYYFVLFLYFFFSPVYISGENLVSFHQTGNQLFMTIPRKLIGRELLFSSCVSKTTHYKYAEVGSRPNVFIGRFQQDGNQLILRRLNVQYIGDETSSSERHSFSDNYDDLYLATYPVTISNEHSITINATTLFLGGKTFSPFSSWFNKADVVYNAQLSNIEEVKSFSDNFSVKCRLSYNITPHKKSEHSSICTAQIVCSAILLTETTMRPRLADSRIGLFTETLTEFNTHNSDSFHTINYCNRWNIQPSNWKEWRQGYIVEPTKHIVYYLDNKFPQSWKEPIRKGVLLWNDVFREMGLKDVIQVKDYPFDDPEFDENSLKYNCIRYIATDRGGAQGPSWADPRTGELLCADIYVWGSILDFVNKSCFVQTAQVNKGIRSGHLSEEEIANHLMCTINHEVGHTLGLAHNMAGSNAYPVDSLLNADFVKRNGLSASTMDYIYFNYIVPAGREDIPLTFHNLGPYDKMVLKYIYQPTDTTLSIADDYTIQSTNLDKYIGKPEYRYVRQQWGTFYDPTAVNYDISNDPIRSGNLGIENLKYVLSHMKQWLPGYSNLELREGYYEALNERVITMLQNNLAYTGGIYLGFQNNGKQFEIIPLKLQRDAFQWVIQRLKNLAWIDNKELTSDFSLKSPASTQIIKQLSVSIINHANKICLSASVATDPYTLEAFVNDIYLSFFDIEKAPNQQLQILQLELVKALVNYNYHPDNNYNVDNSDLQRLYYHRLLKKINTLARHNIKHSVGHFKEHWILLSELSTT